MTPVFCCGFECGVIGPHVTLGTNLSFSTTTVRSGARSLRINPTAGNTDPSNLILGSPGTLVVWRYYLNVASAPTGDTVTGIVVRSNNPTNLVYGLGYKSSDGKWYPVQFTGSTPTFGATGVTLSAGWHRVDLKIDCVNHTLDIEVDGTALTQLTSISTTTIIAVEAGNASGVVPAATYDVFVDDLSVSYTAADYPIGPGYGNHFVPISDGSHNVAGANDFERSATGTDITNATTDAYLLVDDVPLESGTPTDFINLIAPPNATDYVEVKYGPAPGVSTPSVAPRAVEVVTVSAALSTTGNNLQLQLVDNTTTNAVRNATVGSTTCVYNRKHYATAPSGVAWNLNGSGNGAFNNLRMRCLTSDANPDPYFVGTMIEAEFLPAISDLSRDVADSVTVVDDPHAAISPTRISVFDTVSVTDQATPQLNDVGPLARNVFDTIAVTDSPHAAISPTTVAVNDPVTVVDDVHAAISPLCSLVADNIGVLDNVKSVVDPVAVHAVDVITVLDEPKAVVSPLAVHSSDVVAVLDEPKAVVDPIVARPVDAVTVTDAAVPQINTVEGLSWLAFDTVTTTDAVLAAVSPLTQILFDAVTVTDFAKAAVSLAITAYDVVAVSDTVKAVTSPLVARPVDTVSVIDFIKAITTPAVQTVFDTVAVTDDVHAAVSPLTRLAFDDVTAVDFIKAVTSPSIHSMFDLVIVSDTVKAVTSPSTFLISDAITTLDHAVAALLDVLYHQAIFDAVTVTDYAQPQLNQAGTLARLLYESVTVTDGVSAALNPLTALVFDTVITTDTIKAAVDIFTKALADSVSTTDTANGSVQTVLIHALQSDIVTATDAVAGLLLTVAVHALLDDNITVVDDVRVVMTPAVKFVADAVAVLDAVNAVLHVARLTPEVADAIAVVDTAIVELVNLYLAVQAYDAITVSDDVTPLLAEAFAEVRRLPVTVGIDVFPMAAAGLDVFVTTTVGLDVFKTVNVGLGNITPACTAGLDVFPDVGVGLDVTPAATSGLDVFPTAKAALLNVR